MYNNVSEWWMNPTSTSVPLSQVCFRVSLLGRELGDCSFSPQCFWIQGPVYKEGVPKGRGSALLSGRGLDQTPGCCPWAGEGLGVGLSTVKGRQGSMGAPGSGALASATWVLQQFTRGCSVPQFPHKDGRSMWEVLQQAGTAAGEGARGAARKGSGSGSPRVSECCGPPALAVTLKTPLNNSSAFKLGWHSRRLVCVVLPASGAPP